MTWIWEDAYRLEAESIRRGMAEDRAARAEVHVAEHRKVLLDLLASHDGWHDEDCRAYGYGDDADLPPDPSDADPCCTCGRTEIRNQARAVVSAAMPSPSNGDPK